MLTTDSPGTHHPTGQFPEITKQSPYTVLEDIMNTENTTTEITTDATITVETKPAKAKKAPKAKISYPFETKTQILDRIMSDDTYAVQCLVKLYLEQTAYEQSAKTTVTKNKVGFMSSHAVTGSKLAEKAVEQGTLVGEDLDKARSIAARYTRQLAQFSREAALAANPDLAATASIFGL